MIMSRYRYHPVTIPLPSRYRYSVTVTHRRPPLRTVHHRYRPLLTVHHRYRPLLTVTESYRYLRYKRYQRYIYLFNKTLNIYSKGPFSIGNACNASNGKIR